MNAAQRIEAAGDIYSPWSVNGELIAPPAVGRPAYHGSGATYPMAIGVNFPRVIALTGLAGSGKSTVAGMLADYGYTLVKFAAPLKAMLYALGLDKRHIEGELKEVPHEMLCWKSPRQAMQTLGTEWGRKCVGEDFWVNAWAQEARHHPLVVVDDCRFPNEADAVRAMGGVVWEIAGRGGIAGGHESEKGIGMAADRVISNTDDIATLRAAVSYALGYVN